MKPALLQIDAFSDTPFGGNPAAVCLLDQARDEPWMQRVAAEMNRLGLEGVFFRPAVFEPTFHKHAKITCGGCQIHVLDRQRFRPVAVGVALVAAFRAADPDRFRWRDPPYEYEPEKMPFDILAGSSELREQIEAGTSIADITRSWESGVEAFLKIRERFLLYEG